MAILTAEKQVLLDAFQKHLNAELRKDLDTTLSTMTMSMTTTTTNLKTTTIKDF